MRTRIPTELLCGAMFLLAGLMFLVIRLRYFGFAGDAPWDAGWYHSLSMWGYRFTGDPNAQSNLAFFPLHAMLVRALWRLTSLPIWASQIVVSIALSVAGGILLSRAMLRCLAPRYVAMGCMLIAFSPFAIYLYNGYSESAYFFASALLLYAVTHKPRLALAAVAVIVASLSRPWGILAGAVLAICLLFHGFVQRRDNGPTLPRIALTLCASTLGFIGITAYFDWAFGDPLVFMHAASVWSTTTVGFRAGALTAEGVFAGLTKFRDSASDSQAIGVVLYLWAIVVTVLARRWLAREWFFFVAVHAVAFYFLMYWSPHGVLNAGRYSLLLFPATFYALAIFRRIDVALGPDPPTAMRGQSPSARAFEGEPLPLLGYVVLVPFVFLFLRYAADFMRYKWVS